MLHGFYAEGQVAKPMLECLPQFGTCHAALVDGKEVGLASWSRTQEVEIGKSHSFNLKVLPCAKECAPIMKQFG